MIRSLEKRTFTGSLLPRFVHLCGANDQWEIPRGRLKADGPGGERGKGSPEGKRRCTCFRPAHAVQPRKISAPWVARQRTSHVTCPQSTANEPVAPYNGAFPAGCRAGPEAGIAVGAAWVGPAGKQVCGSTGGLE